MKTTEVPREEWGVTLDGFSEIMHDLSCHMWVEAPGEEKQLIADGLPLGQVFYDKKGSEANSVQVALNQQASVYGDFHFMHRIEDVSHVYLTHGDECELADLVVEDATGKRTVLEVDLPREPVPGHRRLQFLAFLRERLDAEA